MSKAVREIDPGSIEHLLTYEWNMDELHEDAINRAVTVGALKVFLFRKHPTKNRWAKNIVGALIELSAYWAYVRGTYYTVYEPNALKKLGCKTVVSQHDYEAK